MSQRKLSRRQAWRIKKIQDERTARAQRKNNQQPSNQALGSEREGLVISHLGTQLDIEANDEAERTIYRCHMRANLDPLVTGDRVIWQQQSDGSGVVGAMLPRQSLLARPDLRGKLRPVAANINRIILVIASEPEPSSVLIDRYLAASELCGITPMLLLNKHDLLQHQDSSEINTLLQRYRNIGYHVMTASCKQHDGLNTLKDLLSQHASVFVGQSGVGKSSLVKALLPDVDIRIGDLSERSKLGVHTTTSARLFHLPDGGHLIDSPGIREFGLWHIEPQRLIDGFPEFAPYQAQCRFRDCSHRHEPHCALQTAAQNQSIDTQRLHNYFQILDSLIVQK